MPNLGFCEFSVRFCEINFEQKYLKKVVKLELGKAKQYSIKICQNIKVFKMRIPIFKPDRKFTKTLIWHQQLQTMTRRRDSDLNGHKS